MTKANEVLECYPYGRFEHLSAPGLVARESDLHGSNFAGANLRGSVWCDSDLSLCHFEWAELSWSNFRGCDLRRAFCRGAKFDGCTLSSTDFRGADLQGADLSGSDLRGAKFHWADVRGVNFTHVKYDDKTELPLEIMTAWNMERVES